MPDNTVPPMRKRLRALRQAYGEQLPHRIAQIEGALATLTDGTDASVYNSVRMMAHSLTGSGVIFGFPALSDVAREFEDFLREMEEVPKLDAEARSRLVGYVEALKRACQEEEGAEPAAEPSLADSPFERQKSKRLVFLISRNGDLASSLAFQLGCFGYLARTLGSCAEVTSRLDESPAAIILDAEPFDSTVTEAGRLREEFQRHQVSAPVVLITTQIDLQSRLRAVRCGVDAFFHNPPDIRKLVERLELLTQSQITDPYRILVVQRRYEDALNCSLTLQRAGMVASLATQPEQALRELVDFEPDLVLVEVDLPDVTGAELAAIIRQSDAYVHVPIVFLAQRTTVERQLEVMRSGADDLITQPVDMGQLISTISYHVQRSRALRYFMAHDSLTGLLNHTEIMQRLEAEFGLALRHERPLAYALLDIDNLRTINERFGYFSGDGVIKALSRLLTQRLRRSDVIGRYSGEEIAVIMPDTTGQQASRVLDDIRALYAEIPHSSVDGTFLASFSAGVASLPGYGLAVEIHEASRRAMQRAIQSGRNRVTLIDQ